jgi:hypothetical protein
MLYCFVSTALLFSCESLCHIEESNLKQVKLTVEAFNFDVKIIVAFRSPSRFTSSLFTEKSKRGNKGTSELFFNQFRVVDDFLAHPMFRSIERVKAYKKYFGPANVKTIWYDGVLHAADIDMFDVVMSLTIQKELYRPEQIAAMAFKPIANTNVGSSVLAWDVVSIIERRLNERNCTWPGYHESFSGFKKKGTDGSLSCLPR